jgi:hypothetical protein
MLELIAAVLFGAVLSHPIKCKTAIVWLIRVIYRKYPRAVHFLALAVALYFAGPYPLLWGGIGWCAHKYHGALVLWLQDRYDYYWKVVVDRVEFLEKSLKDWSEEKGSTDGDAPEPYSGVMFFGSLPSDFGGGAPLLYEGQSNEHFTDEELVQQASAAARVKYGLFARTDVNTKIVDRYVREYLAERKYPRSTILKVSPVAVKVYFERTATDHAVSSNPLDFQ